MNKKIYLISNLLAWGLVLFLIGNYVFGWTVPTATPPSSNLPAPINVSSIEQTKAGNLIIEGVLRLGQFATAPSGTEGALYYDTTEKKMKVYSDSAWSDLGGGGEPGQLPTYTTAERDALSPTTGLMIYNTDYDQVQTYTQTAWIGITGNKDLGIECASAMDCSSGFCVDGVCCDTSKENCNKNCEACNLVGHMGVCTVRSEFDNTEVTDTCYYCNGSSDAAVPYSGTSGVNCTADCYDCLNGDCVAVSKDNDGGCNTVCTHCVGGSCTNRSGGAQLTGCSGCDYCNGSGTCVTCQWVYSSTIYTTSYPSGGYTACSWSHKDGQGRCKYDGCGESSCTNTMGTVDSSGSTKRDIEIWYCRCN